MTHLSQHIGSQLNDQTLPVSDKHFYDLRLFKSTVREIVSDYAVDS